MYPTSFEPNMMILAQTVVELLHGKGQNGVTSEFRVKFDLEGQGQSTPKTIPSKYKVFCVFWIKSDDCSVKGCWVIVRTTRERHTHAHTHIYTQRDAGNENNRRPVLASVKNYLSIKVWDGMFVLCLYHRSTLDISTNYAPSRIYHKF